MTIDEAIAHAKEVSSRKFDDRVHCIRCSEFHEQLAEWLEDFKELKSTIQKNLQEQYVLGCEDGYNKAIDDFVKMAYEELLYSEHLTEVDIDYIAEQLKAGGKNA